MHVGKMLPGEKSKHNPQRTLSPFIHDLNNDDNNNRCRRP